MNKRLVGILLVTISLIALPIAFRQVTPIFFVDFPCGAHRNQPSEVPSDTRIVYCLSLRPRMAISGGGIYDSGSSNQDEIRIGPLTLRRQGSTLSVNGRSIEAGETYATTCYSILSPWVILTSRFEVRNDGRLLDQDSDPMQVVEIPPLEQGGVARSAGVVRNGDSTNQIVALDQTDILADALTVSGDVIESWFPSPIGPAMLIGGAMLIRRAKKATPPAPVETH